MDAYRRQGLLHGTRQDVDCVSAHAKRKRDLHAQSERSGGAHRVNNCPGNRDIRVLRLFADVHTRVEPASRSYG